MHAVAKIILCAAAACTLYGCGKSAQQEAADDAQQWKESVAKAEHDRVARESQLAQEAEQRRTAEAAAQAKLEARDRSIKQDELQSKVKDSMFDPDSAQFRNVRLNVAGDALCGEVNGKNKMGGYVGFHKFVVLHDLPIVDGSDASMYQTLAPTVDCHLE